MNRLVPALALVVLTACPGEDWVPVEQFDEGTVCMSGEAGGPGEILVVGDGCMSSSCSRDFVGTCTATLDGSTVTVTSSLTWEDNASPTAVCTDDCGLPTATCAVEGLPEGEITVVFGEQVQTVTLPAPECSVF